MKLEINQPYGLNLTEEYEYVATYKKGKNSKLKPENSRILLREIITGKEAILFYDVYRGGFGPMGKLTQISILEEKRGDFKHMPLDIIKNRRYIYHKVGNDPQLFNDMLQGWLDEDPMVHVGNKQHSFISKIRNYSWAYKFNGKTY